MNQELNLECNSQKELPTLAKQILEFAGDIKVFLLDAPMGAGKTTFIKELCRQLGSEDNFSSPSFSIVNEYNSPSGKLYHFDLFRIRNSEELFDLGVEEYLDSGNYCFVEWPETIVPLLREQFLKISIKTQENCRYFCATKF